LTEQIRLQMKNKAPSYFRLVFETEEFLKEITVLLDEQEQQYLQTLGPLMNDFSEALYQIMSKSGVFVEAGAQKKEVLQSITALRKKVQKIADTLQGQIAALKAPQAFGDFHNQIIASIQKTKEIFSDVQREKIDAAFMNDVITISEEVEKAFDDVLVEKKVQQGNDDGAVSSTRSNT